ncbi:MAG TPA: DUF5684 domain-containing protein [Verrucomicrobiae bacterium]|jgi:hypothetical protein|nr:DUF5684 domain-containing protein [Verrucomicrobiae bacterium]
MKKRNNVFSWLGWFAALAFVLIPGLAVAQSDDMPSTAMSGAMLVVIVVIGLAFYVYLALAVQTIATKTNTQNAWLAWIPIANIFLLLMIAQKPLWWFILFLIPLVSLVMSIIVWMAVAEKRGKPSWWGILLIVPFVGLIVPGYLAWSN